MIIMSDILHRREAHDYSLLCSDDAFAGPCEPTWTETQNTHVLDGVVNDASTVEACQAACFINTSCTGVDWNPSFTVGQKCWLSGHWSGQRRSRNGITRYDIARPPDSYNCPGMYKVLLLAYFFSIYFGGDNRNNQLPLGKLHWFVVAV